MGVSGGILMGRPATTRRSRAIWRLSSAFLCCSRLLTFFLKVPERGIMIGFLDLDVRVGVPLTAARALAPIELARALADNAISAGESIVVAMRSVVIQISDTSNELMLGIVYGDVDVAFRRLAEVERRLLSAGRYRFVTS